MNIFGSGKSIALFGHERPEELLDFQMEQTLKILSLDLREEAQLEI